MNTVEAIACVIAVRLLDTVWKMEKKKAKENLKKEKKRKEGYFEEIEQNMGDSRYVLDMGLSSSLSFVPLIYLF